MGKVFLIKDIPKDYNKEIYYANINQIKLKPLVYQGLINKIPDLDSIFFLTIGKKKENLNITFSQNFPLLYLPGNYVPINSKNTKYLYEIFPFLMLPVTVNESFSDIIHFLQFLLQNLQYLLLIVSGNPHNSLCNVCSSFRNHHGYWESPKSNLQPICGHKNFCNRHCPFSYLYCFGPYIPNQ